MSIVVETLRYLSIYSALPAVWIGRRQRGLLWYYALFSLSCDVFNNFFGHQFPTAAYVSINLFSVMEPLLIGFYFRNVFSKPWLRQLITAVILITVSAYVFKTWNTSYNQLHWSDVAYNLAMLLLLCILVLFHVMRHAEYRRIERSPLFIFTAFFMLYVAYTTLLTLFAKEFFHAPRATIDRVWAVHNLFNFLKNLAIARVFTLQRSTSTT